MLLIILAVIIVIILAFLKFEHYKKEINMVILVLLLGLIFFSMSSMVSDGRMDFSSPQSTLSSLKFYVVWLGETGLKLVGTGKDTVVTVGNVIKGNQTENKN